MPAPARRSAFFVVQLFVGVMVEQFRASDGTSLLSPGQKRWVELERLMAHLKPRAAAVPPPTRYGRLAHRIATHPYFEAVLSAAIAANVVLMMTFTADASDEWLAVLSARCAPALRGSRAPPHSRSPAAPPQQHRVLGPLLARDRREAAGLRPAVL